MCIADTSLELEGSASGSTSAADVEIAAEKLTPATSTNSCESEGTSTSSTEGVHELVGGTSGESVESPVPVVHTQRPPHGITVVLLHEFL